jgi:hypothetical protein
MSGEGADGPRAMTSTASDRSSARPAETSAPFAKILPVLLITAAAAVLRLARLGEWSLWVDEVLTIDRAEGLGSLAFLRWTPTHVLTRIAVELQGVSEWSARLAPALIGTAAIPLLYVLFLRFVDRIAATIAVGWLALCPWHLYWSQTARGYSALLLFYGAGLLLLLEGLERRRSRRVLWGALILVLATLERRFALLNAGLTLGALAVLQGLHGPGLPRRGRLALLVAATLLGVAALGHEFVAGLSGAEGSYEEFMKFVERGSRVTAPEILSELAVETGLPLLVLAAAGTIRAWTAGTRSERMMTLAGWVPVTALVLLTLFARVYDRFAFVALPFLCLSASFFLAGLLRSPRLSVKLLGVAAALWSALITTGQLRNYYDEHGARDDWRTPLLAIREQKAPDDLLIFHGAILARYYIGDDLEFWTTDERANMETWLPKDRRVWVLLSSDVPPAYESWLEENARRVELDPAGAGQLWTFVAAPPESRRKGAEERGRERRN